MPRTRFAFPLLAYAFAAIMLGTTMPTPMYALYAEQMDFGVLTTTVIYAMYAGGVLFALLVFGRWSDAIGRRPILLAGVVAAVLSAAVFLTADSVAVLSIGRVLSGLSAGLFTGTATAAVIEAAPPNWRARAAAVATIANIGGLGAGPVVAGLLVQYAPEPQRLSFALHIVLALLAGAAVLIAPETSERSGRIGIQRLSVPAEVRTVFVIAAIAGFAGFAVTGLFMAVAPSFVADVAGIDNSAVVGLVASSIFIASAVTQVAVGGMEPQRAVAVGCAILIAGMVILAVALGMSSFLGLIGAGLVSGVGHGIAFSRGLAAIAENTPADRRAEVNSTYFVIGYVAISVPVVGEGLAAQTWGLRTAGVTFAVVVAVLSVTCLVAILVREAREAREARTAAI
ncbi:MFS transporter [Mycolicibacterium elephantis]|uniref:MFS transporter n=2 Tax=Mycolicibacterium elephantis TaxID=81858 RepID=A0A1X0CW45_9MYCO|nr:MFS transporter [Mycolicibacterium elephantis]ORA64384.1 MFS transporter [Mycolicibacterium elephantis]